MSNAPASSSSSASSAPTRKEARAIDRLRSNAEATGRPPAAPNAGSEMRPFAVTAGGQKAIDALHTAIRVSENSNDLGEDALRSLGKQRETLQRTIGTVENTNDNLRTTRRVLHEMKMAVVQERVIKGLILTVLVLIIIIIVYVKWIKRALPASAPAAPK